MTAHDYPVVVTDHAMWRAAERFPHFDTVLIEREVQEALAAGRVSAERGQLGLNPRSDPTSLYVWTADGRRVYALRHDPDTFVVTTTMRPTDMSSASIPGPSKEPTDERTAR